MKQMDTLLFQQSQSIDEIKNRLNCIESGSPSVVGVNNDNITLDDIENIKPALMSDPEFVGGIVDNIMNNSNLSEIIEQIDTLQSENRELRELLHAQQKTINEMNIILLKLFTQSQAPHTQIQTQDPAPAVSPDSDHPPETHETQPETQHETQHETQSQNVELEIVDK